MIREIVGKNHISGCSSSPVEPVSSGLERPAVSAECGKGPVREACDIENTNLELQVLKHRDIRIEHGGTELPAGISAEGILQSQVESRVEMVGKPGLPLQLEERSNVIEVFSVPPGSAFEGMFSEAVHIGLGIGVSGLRIVCVDIQFKIQGSVEFHGSALELDGSALVKLLQGGIVFSEHERRDIASIDVLVHLQKFVSAPWPR